MSWLMLWRELRSYSLSSNSTIIPRVTECRAARWILIDERAQPERGRQRKEAVAFVRSNCPFEFYRAEGTEISGARDIFRNGVCIRLSTDPKKHYKSIRVLNAFVFYYYYATGKNTFRWQNNGYGVIVAGTC